MKRHAQGKHCQQLPQKQELPLLNAIVYHPACDVTCRAVPAFVLQIKGSLLIWLQRDCTVEQPALPPFLRNKLAQAIVGVVKAEYPAVWPNFFRCARGYSSSSPAQPVRDSSQNEQLWHLASQSLVVVGAYIRLRFS